MCGRFSLSADPEQLVQQFALEQTPALEARYNIAPSQDVAAVLIYQDGVRTLRMLRWGLIPSWARDTKIGNRLINARSETVDSKPSFRAAYRRRRCLVLADGFYEWRRLERGKQPYHIRRKDGQPFGIAGLWERWQEPDGEEIESCTLLTTAANRVVAEIHNRMPVILDAADYDRWLDPEQDPGELRALLEPCGDDLLEAFPVNARVNNPRVDDASCKEPAEVSHPTLPGLT